jgi:adenine/guanine phosphoribosyltransferase-like PRPP-binding protein
MVACQPNAQVVASDGVVTPAPIELPAGVTTTVVALTPGKSYTCSVAAKNENGSGPAASQTVTYNALAGDDDAGEVAQVVDDVINDGTVSGAVAAMTSMVAAVIAALMF